MIDKYIYDSAFMGSAATSSAYSARAVISQILPHIHVASVLDVGCAVGTWLRAWAEHGVLDYQGVDGDYVDRDRLEIPSERFTAVDLNAGFDLRRQFDLVQSFEVAEHIDSAAADAFVDVLSRHARRYVLFSAAPPGQGGENHVNEQPYEYWRRRFARRDFVAVDGLRPQIIDNKQISYWYRYNSILYVRRDALALISAAFSRALVPENDVLADISPLHFRLRKAVVARLPCKVRHEIARLKSRVVWTGRF